MYCSLSTGKHMKAVIDAGWGVLVSPSSYKKNRMPQCDYEYCVDNGAWTAYQQGISWQQDEFTELVDAIGKNARFVVVPDVVGDGKESIKRSRAWIDYCRERCSMSLVPVQDGMSEHDVSDMLSSDVGVFVGGTTEWKLNTIPMWSRIAKQHGAYIHVGRVNSVRRINMCSSCGVDSVDGTSAIRFPSTLGRLDAGMRQPSLALEA